LLWPLMDLSPGVARARPRTPQKQRAGAPLYHRLHPLVVDALRQRALVKAPALV
jgi:hypothetical protein